jgi:ABC-type iron transport system FetAB permease component
LFCYKKRYGIWWKNVVTSSRKVLVVLISVIFVGHYVSLIQWIGLILVLICIIVAGQLQLQKEKTKEKKETKVEKKKKNIIEKKNENKGGKKK